MAVTYSSVLDYTNGAWSALNPKSLWGYYSGIRAANSVSYTHLDEAAATPQLPWDLGTDDTNWQGRFTNAAAMGLKDVYKRQG